MQPAEEVAIDLTGEDEVDAAALCGRRRAERAPIFVDLTDVGEAEAVDVDGSSSSDDAISARKRARVEQLDLEDKAGGIELESSGSGICGDSARTCLPDLESSLDCSWCKKKGARIVLTCKHSACATCLAAEAEKTGRCRVCHQRLDVSDLQKVLPSKRMTAFLDRLFESMVDEDDRFLRCPKAGCGNVIERNNEVPKELPTHAPDGQPLSKIHASHMLANRYRCNACTENFCAACKHMPYHISQTCEEAAASRAAVHCRFCSTQLPAGSREGSVCDDEVCQKRKDEACDVVHRRCKHRCLGSFGETECMECLECKGTAGDFCNICWTEELRAAPCLQLKCGHVFHVSCVRERLKKRWPTAKISFTFAKCPLCSVWVQHPELEGAMRSIQQLRQKVEAAALERQALEAGPDRAAEGPAKRDRGSKGKARRVKESSAAAGAGEGGGGGGGEGGEAGTAALKRYNFYLCVRCDRPYFGGAAACGAVEVEAALEGREELMCGACSAQAGGFSGQTQCALHGDKYVEFKCRFCCEVATFFCFGHTHFCESCHRKWTLGAHKNPSSLVQPCKCSEKHRANGTTQASEACYGCSLCRIKTRDSAPI